ncbi:alpha/beta hydrolase [Synechococcus sp. CBW1107]|uniref:alpha/beta hydrolase n=1 Tax=Synechococcus sp. CBW1107 TaxID=2789857 RepID=UPI002AD2855D|nr:alpha/beta fold hydrolase [Synechococcus sp. CBW1107]CAK6694442.1 Carboxylesterase [Synechococcus sp. CBW1107]
MRSNPPRAPVGLLLLHGFSGSTATFAALEPALVQLGFEVQAPLLRGHGCDSPQALAGVTWSDWLDDASAALSELRARAGLVIVVGHSMGALLAALLAAEQPAAIDSLVLAAAPIQLASPLAPGGPLEILTPLLGRLLRRWPMPRDYTDPALDASDTSYRWVPMDALLSFLQLSVVVRRRLAEVHQPVLILQSRADRVVAPAAADLLASGLGTPREQLRMAWFERSGHELFRDCVEGAVIETVLQFVNERINRRPVAP